MLELILLVEAKPENNIDLSAKSMYSEELNLKKIILALGMMFTHMVAPKINFEFFIKKAHEERGTEGVCWYKILQAISESMILVPNLLFYALF